MDLLQVLNDFYNTQIIETVDNTFKIFRTFTYGEMIIAFLLFCILTFNIFKFIWGVLEW